MSSLSPIAVATMNGDTMSTHSHKHSRRGFLQLCAMSSAGLAFSKPASGIIKVGLDIGTAKVCVAVGESMPDGNMKILGIGQAASRGVARHGVVNVEALGISITEALLQAQRASDVMIRSLSLAIIGGKLSARPTTTWDEPCYTDRGDGVLLPISVEECLRLPARRIVYGASPRIQAVRQCLKSEGVEIDDIVLAPVATASAHLSDQQKRLGAIVIDLGESTTDYAVYSNGHLMLSDCIARGGQDVPDEPEQDLGRFFRFLHQHLLKHGVKMSALRAGVHLTGGCSLRTVMVASAQKVFGITAHLAKPIGFNKPFTPPIIQPQHACAISLLRWAPPQHYLG